MGDSNSIRLAGIAYESLVNGPGIRRVLFAQGCKHNCENCFNKHTHCFEDGQIKEINELVEDIISNPMLKGVTFSGGDPIEQAENFAYLAEEVKKHSLNIWCYTGYTFEYILKHQKEKNGWEKLLKQIDVLVDGKYDYELADAHLKFRGSSNQRIIDVQESLRTGEVRVLDYDKN